MTGSNRRSKFTRIAYYLVLFACIIQFYLWIAHIQDISDYGQYFMYISFFEGFFALSGLLFYDPINRRGFHIKPKKENFAQMEANLLVRVIIIFIGLAMIQFTLQIIPLTVKDYEIALSIQFAGSSEEVFFRGVLVSLVILVFHHTGYKIRILKKELSIWELAGIIFVSVGFTALHMNYYGNLKYLLGTFICGLWLGFIYWYWEDLTANILAHSLLNFICIIQSFYLVNF